MKTTKRLLAVLLVITMVLAYVPQQPVYAANNESQFAGGSGTAADPYLIATKEHLNNVRNDLDAHYKMIADIVFTDADFAAGGSFYNDGTGWDPIGNKNAAFSGTFDGDGHYIHNMYIDVATLDRGTTYAGLFGCVYGSIKHIGIISAIINVQVKRSSSGSTEFCNTYVGGIAGYSGLYSSIEECYFSGKITLVKQTYNSIVDLGGIVGSLSGTVSNCYNMGTIQSGTDGNIGGIAGFNFGEIINCYNVGNVSGSPYASVGGITGYDYDELITNCYYLDKNYRGAGNNKNLATSCSTDDMRKTSTYVGFAFGDIWTMSGNSNYPFPELISTPGVTVKGDIDGNLAVTQEDAVYLLLHTMFGEMFYPLNNAPADIDGSGTVDQDDAVYLLLHTMFGETFYPLNTPALSVKTKE